MTRARARLAARRRRAVYAYVSAPARRAVLAAARHAAIGFVEAHGLAFIFAVLLWQAPPIRYAHLTASAVMALLGVSNQVFWPLFTSTGMIAAGVALTSAHLAFAALQFHAARKVDLQLA